MKKWVDCTIDEKLEFIKSDIDELYRRIQEAKTFQYDLAKGLLEVRQKLNLPDLPSAS